MAVPFLRPPPGYGSPPMRPYDYDCPASDPKALLAQAQIGAIAAHLDRNEDGRIDYQARPPAAPAPPCCPACGRSVWGVASASAARRTAL